MRLCESITEAWASRFQRLSRGSITPGIGNSFAGPTKRWVGGFKPATAGGGWGARVVGVNARAGAAGGWGSRLIHRVVSVKAVSASRPAKNFEGVLISTWGSPTQTAVGRFSGGIQFLRHRYSVQLNALDNSRWRVGEIDQGKGFRQSKPRKIRHFPTALSSLK